MERLRRALRGADVGEKPALPDLEGGPGTFLLFNEFGQCVLQEFDIKLIDTVDALAGAYLEVREQRFDRNGIRQLYENEAFPLRRLKVAS